MTEVDLKLLQGTLDTLVLRALRRGAKHGYEIAGWVRDTTDDALQIEEGALYTALHRMQKRGWLEAQWGVSDNNRRAKFYELTASGRKRLDEETENWDRLSEAVIRILQTT